MTWIVQSQLIADMQQAQLLMLAGFVMLGWVLARRQLKMRKRVNQDSRVANRALKQMRAHKNPAVPLSDAPPETQRWQVAMFDLQRELKAELDTRIVVVQTLLNQVDQRIARLSALDSSSPSPLSTRTSISSEHQQMVRALLERGHTAKEIAVETGLPLGDVELAISTAWPF
jgi:hypothetical protein